MLQRVLHQVVISQLERESLIALEDRFVAVIFRMRAFSTGHYHKQCTGHPLKRVFGFTKMLEQFVIRHSCVWRERLVPSFLADHSLSTTILAIELVNKVRQSRLFLADATQNNQSGRAKNDLCATALRLNIRSTLSFHCLTKFFAVRRSGSIFFSLMAFQF